MDTRQRSDVLAVFFVVIEHSLLWEVVAELAFLLLKKGAENSKKHGIAAFLAQNLVFEHHVMYLYTIKNGQWIITSHI
jgi:hypothetical protein